ncbi:right-handed parallel beta-helix repeat-containing protein, partial [uncultured Methanobrevibacter sp.]|uniref:right-handed parallel beta-helix repeat-containing protein n=1 Tax=uncultured Methanobrevibacter sp. TaxID=253161 RepID=UPI0025DFA005
MKIGKNIFICILLVLMLLCCINASSAQDTLDDTLGADISNQLEINDTLDDKLSANGDTIVVDVNGEGQYESISAAVSAATGGETILVRNGEYSEANTITFTKSVSIVGESQDGVKITGTTKSLFSTVEPAIVLSLTNLTILNAGGGSNPALKLTYSGHDLTVINCTFDSCGSKWGTMQFGHPGTAIIDNCKILNSKEMVSAGAGAVYISGAGQYTISNTIIDNVQYIPTSSYMQAAIYVSNANAVLNIENTIISNITAPTRGVIQTTGTVNIKGSKIQDNTLNQFSDSMTSHVIYLGDKGTVNIEQTEISDNTCVSQLFNNYKDTSKLTVNYCNIHDNAASATVNNLGTIDLEANWWGSSDKPADVTVDTWVVDNNGNYELNNGEPLAKEIPGLNGGDEPPVLPEGTIYISETGDDANNGSSEEYAIATLAHAVEIVNARENKTATVYMLNGDYTTAPVDITELNLTFIGQEKGKVIIHGTGKYIFDVYGDHLISKFENIDFVDSYSPSGNMGALRLYADYTEFTINNCNFRNISAKYGAIDLQADYGNINITNCVIEDVTGSTSMSAIVYINGASTSIFDNIEITNCRLDETYASENPTNYLRSIFYVASKTSTVTLTNLRITDNYGPMYGGVIESKSKMTVENTVISDNVVNTSVNGANGGEYLIWASDDDADISMANCVITNNTIVKTTRGLFYNQKGSINVEYSDISGNDAAKFVGSTGTIIADNNWWGTNDQPDSKVNKWVIMNVVTDDSDLSENNKVTFTVDFNHVLTSSGNLENLTGGEIPKDKYAVTLTAKNGEITPTSIVVNKGQTLTKTFTVTEINDEITLSCDGDDVTVILEGIPPYRGIIYVNTTGNDTNEGSIDAPVATIAKAVELALTNGGSGEIIIDEGTYVGNGYHVNGDLNVTGNGKVTLDANNEGRLFYMEYGDTASKIELHNLVLTNANGFGAAVYSLANELILDNVTIVNNQASNYLITSKGKLTITDSEISNSMSGDVIQQTGNGDILINNTVFKDNSIVDSTNVMAVINLNSASGNLVVENSKFINNTARQGVIKGNYNYNINVKGTEFIDNTNTASYGGAVYTSGGILNVTDCVFVNNKAARSGGAIYVGYRTTATVEKSVFVNNTANTMSDEYYGDAIYDGNKLTVNNSVLLTNSNNFLIYSDGENNVPYAQNNWWGTNDDPSSLNGYGYYEDDDWQEYDCPEVDVSNWVTMDASFTPADAQAGDEVTVIATFSNVNLPDGINVTFTSTSGNLNAVVSTVDAKASTSYTIDANDEAIVAASGNATVNMPIAQDLSNIVTNDTFYNFFDENGVLLNTVEFDELIFQGNFSDLATGYVILIKPITITGDNAVLNNLGIVVSASDITLNNLTLIADISLGDLVYVEGNNVNLNNLDITYTVGDESARAISIIDATDVNVINATIAFESHVTDSANDGCAINIEESQNVVVNGSEINSSLPALYVNYEAVTTQFMGLDKVNPIRVVKSNTVEITKNIINSETNDYSQAFATIQAIAVLETNDCLIDSNNITLTDEFAQTGQDIYLYGITFAYDEGLVMSNNNFTVHTNGGKKAAGTAYAIQGIESELSIICNNITTFSNGPNLGIYVTSMAGEGSIMLIENNFINVTGLAASGDAWALVSGIEIQNGDSKVYNNTIYTYNVADYGEDDYLSGISYIQYMYGGRSFDIQDNYVWTGGKYAIYLLEASNSIITGNELYGHDLYGNNAVFIQSGDNNIIEDNIPQELTNIVTNDTFYNFFDEFGNLLDSVEFDELIFQGEFSDLVSYITIDRALTITGGDAVLNDIAFVIAGSGVTLDNMTLVANSNL